MCTHFGGPSELTIGLLMRRPIKADTPYAKRRKREEREGEREERKEVREEGREERDGEERSVCVCVLYPTRVQQPQPSRPYAVFLF